MSRTKATLIKKPKFRPVPARAVPARTEQSRLAPVAAEKEEMPVISGLMKQKIPIEFGEEEPLVDEKTEEEVAIGADGEELVAEELSLDEEEINPFGDKWEE